MHSSAMHDCFWTVLVHQRAWHWLPCCGWCPPGSHPRNNRNTVFLTGSLFLASQGRPLQRPWFAKESNALAINEHTSLLDCMVIKCTPPSRPCSVPHPKSQAERVGEGEACHTRSSPTLAESCCIEVQLMINRKRLDRSIDDLGINSDV